MDLGFERSLSSTSECLRTEGVVDDDLVRGSVPKPGVFGVVQSFSIAMASAEGLGDELRARSGCGRQMNGGASGVAMIVGTWRGIGVVSGFGRGWCGCVSMIGG